MFLRSPPRYVCCGGIFGEECCVGVTKGNECCCLVCEICCCYSCAVHGNRWLTQKRYGLRVCMLHLPCFIFFCLPAALLLALLSLCVSTLAVFPRSLSVSLSFLLSVYRALSRFVYRHLVATYPRSPGPLRAPAAYTCTTVLIRTEHTLRFVHPVHGLHLFLDQLYPSHFRIWR